jgi:sensor histidine kinase regulating citrate/malate metabolism
MENSLTKVPLSLISLLSNAIESFRETQTNRKIIIKLDQIKNKTILLIRDYGRGIKEINKILKLTNLECSPSKDSSIFSMKFNLTSNSKMFAYQLP